MTPISFIGYMDDLQQKEATERMGDILNQCVDASGCEGAFYIYHFPEESDLKAHFHVLFIGEVCQKCRVVDKIMKISLPYLTMPRQSKITDWLLYAIHDENYLSVKGLAKKWHYQRERVKSTNEQLLIAAWQSIADDPTFNDVRNRIQQSIRSGGSVEDAVIAANPRPNEVHGSIEYAKMFYNYYQKQIDAYIKASIQNQIDEKEREKEKNGNFKPEQNDEYFRAVQFQLEEFYRTSQRSNRN